MTARERGIAVGIASALPVSIERIAEWAKAAESRGLLLVPITAVAIKAKSSCNVIASAIECATLITASPMPPYETLPYRPCAGIMVLNRAGLRLHRPAHRAAPSTSTPPMSGRCRRAASTRARTPSRRRCASFTRKPTSARSKSSARSRTGSPTTSRATSSAQAWKRQIPRPEAEMVRAALHRRRQRDRHQPGRRPQAGIHRLALGGDGRTCRSWSCRSSADLRAGGAGIREVCEK